MNLMSRLRALHRNLSAPFWVSPPAVWGKLPTYGDYVHHNAALDERQAWSRWVDAVWHMRPEPKPNKARARGWLSLDAPAPKPQWHALPIAFVLPPDALGFAPHEYVQGVLVASADKVGRSCPLVVYQKFNAPWFRLQWPARSERDGQNLLFWWSRMLAQMATQRIDFQHGVHKLEQAWNNHAPKLSQRWGASAPSPSPDAMRALLDIREDQDPADAMHGVFHFPWADWPERCITEARSAFWTQDARGRYVQAAETLPQLWGRS